jgi:hypothetical protein
MDIYPPHTPVREGPSTYQKLLVPLRKQTPDKDVVMLSPSPKNGATSTRPVFTNDDFIPFSCKCSHIPFSSRTSLRAIRPHKRVIPRFKGKSSYWYIKLYSG